MSMHPQVVAFLAALEEQEAPGWEEMNAEEGREVFSGLSELFGQGPDLSRVEDRLAGDHVPIRVYRPRDTKVLPVIVFMHGGGWVLGDLDTHDALCRRLAFLADSVVVSVDYRRSPETRFPGSLEDCYAALQFVRKHADSLRIDPEKIIVAGDSAGGNLAAATAAMSYQRQGPTIRLQVLIYPVLDYRCNSDSYRKFADGFGLTGSAMKWFWQQYLGDGADGENGMVSPLLANDLSGVPPTHVVTAECDVLRDEGEQYMQRLKEAGVPATHRRYDGMIHGFVHFAGVFDIGREAVDDIADVIRSECSAMSSTQMRF